MIPQRALKAVNFLKKAASMIALIYSIVVVARMILEENTKLSSDVTNWFAFIAMFLALAWLARVEGSQAAMVGLPPVDPSLFEKSHPIAFRVCKVGHRGDNLDRYLMGRQFIVLVLVFVINLAGTPADGEDIEYHTNLSSFLIQSGVALILITAMIGQLNSQVTASHCMLGKLCHARTILQTLMNKSNSSFNILTLHLRCRLHEQSCHDFNRVSLSRNRGFGALACFLPYSVHLCLDQPRRSSHQ